MQGADAEVVQALARADLDAAPLTPKERVLMEFVELVTRRAYDTRPPDVQRLRDAGWTEPQIAEAVYIIAMFAFFNRVADAFGLPDPGYFQHMAPSGDGAGGEEADAGNDEGRSPTDEAVRKPE